MFETTFLGSNINRVKAHNVQAVLLSLLYEEPLSRAQLALRTNLSSTTITNLVTELIENGIVTDECGASDEKQRPVGRPPTGLFLIPHARYAVGVHIGVGLFRVALVNLRAEIVANTIVNFPVELPALEVLGQVCDTITAVLNSSDVEENLVLGVGVGASGLVNYTMGVNILAPSLDWHEVPVRDVLQNRLGLSVVVDNNVRAMALGEAYFGSGRNAQSLAFVYGRIGVGAGFVVDGQLFRGSSTGAGEIGHMIIVPENGLPCRCGKQGCLETLVSEVVILRQAQEIARQKPDGLLAQSLAARLDGSDELTPIERVFRAARAGDADAQHLVEQVGNYLGIALANLVNIFNPELIVLGGMFVQGEDLILPVAAQVLRHSAFANLGEKVRLMTTQSGWRAGVIGAATLALLRFFYQQSSIYMPNPVNN